MLEANPLRSTVNYLWGYIHSAGGHEGESCICMEKVCAKARAALEREESPQPGIEWAVRYHSTHGHHTSRHADEEAARQAAKHHATLPDCRAEVLTRAVIIPEWIVAAVYPDPREQLVSDMAGRLDMPDLTELPSGGGHYQSWNTPLLSPMADIAKAFTWPIQPVDTEEDR